VTIEPSDCVVVVVELSIYLQYRRLLLFGIFISNFETRRAKQRGTTHHNTQTERERETERETEREKETKIGDNSIAFNHITQLENPNPSNINIHHGNLRITVTQIILPITTL